MRTPSDSDTGIKSIGPATDYRGWLAIKIILTSSSAPGAGDLITPASWSASAADKTVEAEAAMAVQC